MTDEPLDFSEFLPDDPTPAETPVRGRDTRSQAQKDRHEKFCEIAIATGNSSEAARQCGYKTLIQPQSPYLRKTLAERRAKYAEQYNVSAENVIRGHARVAFLDMRNVVDDEGNPLGVHELDDEVAMALSGVDVMEMGRGNGFARVLKYKANDRQKALDSLSRHLGLFKEDNDQANKPLIGVLDAMTENEVARRLAFYLQEAMRKRGEEGAKEAQAADGNKDGI